MTEISQRQVDLIKHLSEKNLTPEELGQIEAISGIRGLTHERAAAITEAVEVDSRLTKFAEMYSKWSAESKSRLDWKKVQNAMLANDGALLKQVEEIPRGPIMFGADKDGNILFANGGSETILEGTYSKARKAAKDIGLELFTYVKPYQKSEEILMFEVFTGKPIISSKNEQTKLSIWLEDGDNDANIGYVCTAKFNPGYGAALCGVPANWDSAYIGVRGLLRAKA